MTDTAPATFTPQELWLVHHQLPAAVMNPGWTDLSELHNLVNDGLVFCHETDEPEATLLLKEKHCEILAAVIKESFYDATNDNPIGETILLKSFKASRAIRFGEFPTASVGGSEFNSEQVQRLLAFRETLDDGTEPSPD